MYHDLIFDEKEKNVNIKAEDFFNESKKDKYMATILTVKILDFIQR